MAQFESLPTFYFDFAQTFLLEVCSVVILAVRSSPWSRVPPEKLTGPQLLKEFPTIYGTRRFITSYRTAHNVFPEPDRAGSCPSSHFWRNHSNIILPSTPGSSKWSPSLRIPRQNTVCTSPLSLLHATYATQLSLLDLIIRIIFGEEYRA